MKKLLLVLLAFALITGMALATEVIGTASNVQGTVWVQHDNADSKVQLTDGMQLLDDDQIFLEKNSSFKANSAFGAPAVTISFGDIGYWDADKGTKNPPTSDWVRCRGVYYTSFY
jgi:hypothetical protein